MKLINGPRLLFQIRQALGETPDPSRADKTSEDVETNISTRFSNLDLSDRVFEQVLDIYRTTKACNNPSGIKLSSSSTGTLTLPDTFLRILTSSVSANGIKAVYRSPRRLRALNGSGRTPTAAAPLYTTNGADVEVFPASSMEVYYFDAPTKNTTDIQIDARFTSAVIYGVIASCQQTLENDAQRDIARKFYNQELEPYMLNTKFSSLPDKEVEVEN